MALTAIECPYCQAELFIPDESRWYTCESCQHGLNARAQRAYARGRAGYLQAETLEAALRSSGKKAPQEASQQESLFRYQEARAALEEAFRAGLADSQRETGIEMMAEIAGQLARHGKASEVEVSYWVSLLAEVRARRECEALREKLEGANTGGIVGALQRRGWQARCRQLEGALGQLDRKIRQLAEGLGLPEAFRARRPRV